MCGIIAVIRRPSDRPVPDLRDILVRMERAAGALTHRAAGR